MPGNPREMITMAERRFPLRVRIGVPPGCLFAVPSAVGYVVG